MPEVLESACTESINAGYEGLSLAGENTWSFHTEEAFDEILKFEAAFDAREPDSPVTALCQYDIDRFSEESVAKALWTHEQIIYRGRVCENPYYVAPEEYTTTEKPQLNARLMLEQAYDLTRTQQQVERREQRLSIVNRILRHNIRNDLNVIIGNLSLVQEKQVEQENRIETAIEVAASLVDIAEKARYIQETLSDPTLEVIDLEGVVENAIQRITKENPDAEITVSQERGAIVLADMHLEDAIVELLGNIINHQNDDSIVTVSISEIQDDSITLEVSSPGTPLPETDRQALLQGYETPLEHEGDLGLWLVKWIVENSHGSISIPESSDEHRIKIDLPQETEIEHIYPT